MVSPQLFNGILAILAANAVNAGPCRPSSSAIDTTATAETVSETVSLSETTTTIDSSTTLLIATTTTQVTSDATTTTAAASTAAAAPGLCSTNADCEGATPFCDAGTCVATDPNTQCNTDTNCDGICVDNVCVA